MTPSHLLDIHATAYQGGNLYDFDNGILMNWYARRVCALAPRARSLLELGLGHGITTRLFGDHFSRHVVVDGSPSVIGHFRRQHPDCHAEIVEAWFEHYETDERFDVIVCGFVLEHVEDPVLLLARMRRLLAPGGRMFVAVPNAEGLNRRLGHLAGLLPDMQALSAHDLLLGHRRYYTVRSLHEHVESAGASIARLEGIYLKPLTTRQMLAQNLEPRFLDALCQVGIDYPELSCGLLAEVADGP